MKKIVLVVIFTLLAFCQLFSQTRPIMGYDQVAWGTSIQTVRNVYNISNEIETTPAADDPNIMQISQENVSNSIAWRIFMFNNDKLYRVTVEYKDTSDSTAQNLQSILVNRFGSQTNYDIQTGTTTLMFQRLNYTVETRTYGSYSPELVVELIHRVVYAGLEKDTRNLLGQNSLFIRYTWKRFRDEYQASRLGL